MKRALFRVGIVMSALLAAVAVPAFARAASPSNDDFAAATAIDPAALPFSDAVAVDEASLEPGEPTGCYIGGKSVWYAVTPAANGLLRADISSSSFSDRILYVYRQNGSGFGGLSTIACASPYYNGLSTATFSVEAGVTYYLQAGGFYAWSAGTLRLTVAQVASPPNDDFADATAIPRLPFDDSVDPAASTAEAGEPNAPECTGPPASSVWWKLTPSVDESVTATTGSYWNSLAVYSGDSLGGLSVVACRNGGQQLTFRARANTTYYFQGIPLNPVGGGAFAFHVAVAPPPVAAFWFSPGDPSSFDDLQFQDQSYDPAGAGIASEAWDFGDGSTASGCCPRHHYASDGDYVVHLDVATGDGRTASAERTVNVRTHDVTISKLLVPQSARAGQTKEIVVGLTNTRYPEIVLVQVFRSVAGGRFEQAGALMQSVPVRGPNRTTSFSINYTFSDADAAVGKVTFQAVATIQGGRDALPADNTIVALPTKVTP